MAWKVLIAVLVALNLAAFGYLMFASPPDQPLSSPPPRPNIPSAQGDVPMAGSIENLDTSTFDAAVKSGVTLVDFWAPWCGPCRAQGPILEELAAEIAGKGVKIAKVNTDENGEIAARFDVSGIPTLVILKDGEEATRFVGVQQKNHLAAELAKYL